MTTTTLTGRICLGSLQSKDFMLAGRKKLVHQEENPRTYQNGNPAEPEIEQPHNVRQSDQDPHSRGGVLSATWGLLQGTQDARMRPFL